MKSATKQSRKTISGSQYSCRDITIHRRRVAEAGSRGGGNDNADDCDAAARRCGGAVGRGGGGGGGDLEFGLVSDAAEAGSSVVPLFGAPNVNGRQAPTVRFLVRTKKRAPRQGRSRDKKRATADVRPPPVDGSLPHQSSAPTQAAAPAQLQTWRNRLSASASRLISSSMKLSRDGRSDLFLAHRPSEFTGCTEALLFGTDVLALRDLVSMDGCKDIDVLNDGFALAPAFDSPIVAARRAVRSPVGHRHRDRRGSYRGDICQACMAKRPFDPATRKFA